MKKMQFNVVHVLAPPLHGLYGYREVLETVHYGLTALGHEATLSENVVDKTKTNIIVGAQMLSEPDLRALPRGTIVYNFEQMRGAGPGDHKPAVRAAAENFQIWDYSEANIPSWEKLKPARRIVHVPVGWAPILNRIGKTDPQDIDALLYGLPGPLRLEIFNALSHQGMKCVFVSGLYGSARDSLISKSKLVLNINLYDHARIFEIVRVSYLLANSKAVVADFQEGTFIEPDLETAVAFSRPDRIGDACASLLNDDRARSQLEDRGREAMEKRDIVPILRAALEASGLS
jgi:hypothetical protein